MAGAARRARQAVGLLLAIALSALAAGVAAAWLAPGGRAIGLAPDERARAPTVEALVAAIALDPRRARARLRLPHAARRAPTAAPPDGRRPGVPVRISIPSAEAAGPVDRMRVRGGMLEIPPPGRAGWFAAGPRPGELGRAVIVSHVDSEEGPALFYGLLQLGRGSRIAVRDGRGELHRFAVVRRRQVEKTRFPAGAVYGGSDRPMLVLITCGGPYSPESGYRDNVILHARAV